MSGSDSNEATPSISDALRLNGDRFVTGAVRYLDDALTRPDLHLAFVRSPHAHARIRAIDTTKAAAQAGVQRILTGRDAERLIADMKCRTPVALTDADEVLTVPCLAVDHVRYCGE